METNFLFTSYPIQVGLAVVGVAMRMDADGVESALAYPVGAMVVDPAILILGWRRITRKKNDTLHCMCPA
jgi:hypothetical protein